MATLTEQITQELLDALDQWSPIGDVLKAHASTKGPLYNAIAAATAQMGNRLFDQARREQTLRSSCVALETQREAEETRCQQLKLQAQSLEASRKESQQGVDSSRVLLDSPACHGLDVQAHGLAVLARAPALRSWHEACGARSSPMANPVADGRATDMAIPMVNQSAMQER